MFLSVSRRTDIPAFYSDWFFKRVDAGFLYVRNPMNFHQVSKINLSQNLIDCIVFWTKDPSKIISKLDLLDKQGYRYYFQITINDYGGEIERNTPGLKYTLKSFKDLSNKIGNLKTIWRYDPIILSERLTLDYHIEKFTNIAKELKGYAKRCVISFLDIYSRTEKKLEYLKLKEISEKDMEIIAEKFSIIAEKNGLEIFTCSEKIDLKKYGVKHGKCIDDELFYKIFKVSVNVKKDNTQRKECGCVKSVDIGAYNTCENGCLYCYANFNDGLKNTNIKIHNPLSPFLFGGKEAGDKINERKMESFIKEEDNNNNSKKSCDDGKKIKLFLLNSDE